VPLWLLGREKWADPLRLQCASPVRGARTAPQAGLAAALQTSSGQPAPAALPLSEDCGGGVVTIGRWPRQSVLVLSICNLRSPVARHSQSQSVSLHLCPGLSRSLAASLTAASSHKRSARKAQSHLKEL
jgi:hypothetical protein